MVVYQALYGDYRVYVRPYEMFVSEVDHEKYPQVTQKYRFELAELSETEKPVYEKALLQDGMPQKDASRGEDGPALEKTCRKEKETAQGSPLQTGDGSVNPILLEFLDAETLEEKLHIMIFGRNQMDDNLLNSIAISLDLVVDEKSTQEKYDEILNCLSMMERFECNRLR